MNWCWLCQNFGSKLNKGVWFIINCIFDTIILSYLISNPRQWWLVQLFVGLLFISVDSIWIIDKCISFKQFCIFMLKLDHWDWILGIWLKLQSIVEFVIRVLLFKQYFFYSGMWVFSYKTSHYSDFIIYKTACKSKYTGVLSLYFWSLYIKFETIFRINNYLHLK